jgi:hypothetical protein
MGLRVCSLENGFLFLIPFHNDPAYRKSAKGDLEAFA